MGSDPACRSARSKRQGLARARVLTRSGPRPIRPKKARNTRFTNPSMSKSVPDRAWTHLSYQSQVETGSVKASQGKPLPVKTIQGLSLVSASGLSETEPDQVRRGQCYEKTRALPSAQTGKPGKASQGHESAKSSPARARARPGHSGTGSNQIRVGPRKSQGQAPPHHRGSILIFAYEEMRADYFF